MDAMEAIFTRRSIRAYTDQPVAEELIEDLLKAATAAPSAGNQQPWHFVVIDDRTTLDAIPEYHAYSAMLKGAPAAIVVCSDGGREGMGAYWPQDCSAATQNLLLAAHVKGLGAVWLGVYPRQERQDDIRGIFDLPAHVHPFALVSLGYPGEEKKIPDRFKPERIHWNKWDT